MAKEKKTYVEKIKKQLEQYEVGNKTLAEVLAGVIEACGDVTEDENEFKICVDEVFDSLRKVIKKAKT